MVRGFRPGLFPPPEVDKELLKSYDPKRVCETVGCGRRARKKGDQRSRFCARCEETKKRRRS